LAINNRISPASLCYIIRETVRAIIIALKDEFLPDPNTEVWKKNEEGFSSI